MPDNAGRLWRGAIRILIFFFNNFFKTMYSFELIKKWKHLTTLELFPDHPNDRDGSRCFRLNSWQIRSKINFSGDIIWSHCVWYTMIMIHAWYTHTSHWYPPFHVHYLQILWLSYFLYPFLSVHSFLKLRSWQKRNDWQDVDQQMKSLSQVQYYDFDYDYSR